MADFWVFAYGSLMWRPGFDYEEALPAVLPGAHRALCVYSVIHRGTPRRPGLVLGLDAGGRCQGMAFRINGRCRQQTLAYLRAREQGTKVYREVVRSVALADGSHRRVRALCYVVDRGHAQYAGRLPLELQAWLVRRSRGRSGDNVDYVASTVAHLRASGIHDAGLERLAALLGRCRTSQSSRRPFAAARHRLF